MELLQIDYENEGCVLPEAVENSIRGKIPLFLEKLKVGNKMLTIFFCSSEKIQELNAEFREKDKATDILSWGYEADDGDDTMMAEMPWGELALCLDVCQKQADDSGWDLETELLRLLAHGVVHVLGYDHETPEEESIMLQLELELLSIIGLDKIYQ